MTSEWQFYLSTPALSRHEEGRGNNLLYFPFLRTLQSYSVRAEKHRDSTEVTNFLFHESHFLGTFYLKKKPILILFHQHFFYKPRFIQYKSLLDAEIHGGTWTE